MSNQPCIFPFTYNNITYTNCTNEESSYGPWCGLIPNVRNGGYNVEGIEWDYCNETHCAEESFPGIIFM